MPSRVSLMPVSSSTLVEARTWTDARFAALRAAGAERRAEDLPERMESFAETRGATEAADIVAAMVIGLRGLIDERTEVASRVFKWRARRGTPR